MARDNHIERAKRDLPPAPSQRELTVSERVQLLVSDVLYEVSVQIEERHAQDQDSRKR